MILQFPTGPMPAWARFGRYGEGGSYGYQIDASGLENRNYMFHRELFPFAADVSLQARFRVNSTLTVGNPAYEGFAFRSRGYQLDGTAPNHTDRKVWDSTPSGRGASAWYSRIEGWSTISFIVSDVPDNAGIDYLTFEAVTRAINGQINISAMEFRHRYEKVYTLGNGLSGQWSLPDLSQVHIFGARGGSQPKYRYSRYLDTKAVVIKKGQRMDFDITYATWSLILNQSLVAQDGVAGMMVKLRNAQDSGDSTYVVLDEITASVDIDKGTNTVSLQADRDFDQIELLAFFRLNVKQGVGAASLAVYDVGLTVTVHDWIV